jgi:prolyl oligopeptidase
METTNNPELQSWMSSQNDYARVVLSKIPGRNALLQRIQTLSNAGTSVYQVVRGGTYYFYLRQEPGAEIAKLYVRSGLKGPERLLVDPSTLNQDGNHRAIDWFIPSPDGRYVAYGVSIGGSEESALKIVDTTTGRRLPENIDRANYGVTAWLPSSKGFFYIRLQNLPKGASDTDKYAKSQVFEHVIGNAPDGREDVAVFGYRVSAAVPVDDTVEVASLVASPVSSFVYGTVQKNVANEFSLYVAPLNALKGALTPWRKVADETDDVTQADIHGDDIYLLTHKDASNYKVLRTSLSHPDFGHADVVVPVGRAVIKKIAVANDALYVQENEGGIGRVLRIPFEGSPKPEPVQLPYDGAIQEFVGKPDLPGILLKMSSWTKPQLWYHYDPKIGSIVDTGLRAPSPVDYSAITSTETEAQSADGAMIPLSVIHRRDIKLDGTNPTLLNGYGAYGVSQDPAFDPTRLAWLERGGIIAVAHIRGGGEYGEGWHAGGQKLTKQNTIADFIACAECLIAHGYTSPAKLAAEGGSAGGITVGGALTQRPDLFAAILDESGMSDMLRFETTPNGPSNTPEFGTVADPDGFEGLLEMSPIYHIIGGTPYPAVLLTTGVNDPRVAPWQMAKMAARLLAATSGTRPILLRVNSDAGHGSGNATKSEGNLELADQWTFLLWQFGVDGFQPFHS